MQGLKFLSSKIEQYKMQGFECLNTRLIKSPLSKDKIDGSYNH